MVITLLPLLREDGVHLILDAVDLFSLPSTQLPPQREGWCGHENTGLMPCAILCRPFRANSNRSNPIQTVRTQFKPISNPSRTHLEPQLKIHISSHAARDSEGGSNSRGYRHDELNNQLPSILFRFSTHNAIFLLNINFLEVRGEISHKRTCPDCRTLRT